MRSPTEQLRKLTPPQQAALSLLRHAIFPDEPKFRPDADKFCRLNANDWTELHKFTVRQGFAAIAFDSLRSLSVETSIPKNLKISWGMATDIAIRKYRYFCQQAPEFEEFFSTADLIPVHMKGLALSMLYPRPELRECGDYDFFLLKKDCDPNRQDLFLTAMEGEKLAVSAGIEVDTSYPKHSNFHFKGIAVECHRFFLSSHNPHSAAPVEPVLHKHLAPQVVQLPTGERIHAASPTFSKIFVAFHALQHAGGGLRIRHLVDWALTCKAYGDNLPGEGYSTTLKNGASSLCALSNLLLGTDFKVEDNPQLTSRMLHAILHPELYERMDSDKELLGRDFNLFVKMTRRQPLRSIIFPGEKSYFSALLSILKRRIKRIRAKYLNQ